MSPRIDRSKPLKDQFAQLAVEAGLIEETQLALPAPANDDQCDCNLPPSNTTMDGVQDEVSVPPSMDDRDDVWKHKLGEAVLPVRLIKPFLNLFQGMNAQAHMIQQIANRHGEIREDVRHVYVYDTHENLRKYERQS